MPIAAAGKPEAKYLSRRLIDWQRKVEDRCAKHAAQDIVSGFLFQRDGAHDRQAASRGDRFAVAAAEGFKSRQKGSAAWPTALVPVMPAVLDNPRGTMRVAEVSFSETADRSERRHDSTGQEAMKTDLRPDPGGGADAIGPPCGAFFDSGSGRIPTISTAEAEPGGARLHAQGGTASADGWPKADRECARGWVCARGLLQTSVAMLSITKPGLLRVGAPGKRLASPRWRASLPGWRAPMSHPGSNYPGTPPLRSLSVPNGAWSARSRDRS